jgi:hypothetical protein
MDSVGAVREWSGIGRQEQSWIQRVQMFAKFTKLQAEELRRRNYGYKYEKVNKITSAITFSSVLGVM